MTSRPERSPESTSPPAKWRAPAALALAIVLLVPLAATLLERAAPAALTPSVALAATTDDDSGADPVVALPPGLGVPLAVGLALALWVGYARPRSTARRLTTRSRAPPSR